MKLSTRLLLMLLAVALLPMLLLGALGIGTTRDELQQDRIGLLNVIANLNVQHVEATFHERRDDIRTLQDSFNISKNLPILEAGVGKPESAAYRKARKLLDDELGKFIDIYIYDNVLLLDTHGRLVYGAIDSLIGQKLGKPMPAPFNGIFAMASKGLYISPAFSGHTNETNHMHLLLAAPIRKNGFFIGEVVLQVDLQALYTQLLKTESLGKTGEILLGTQHSNDIQFISPTRTHPDGELLKLPWDSDIASPMQMALQGESGAGPSIDYRGHEVLAAWRPIPDLGWGLVVKYDNSEAISSIRHLEKIGLGMLLLGTLLSFGLAFAASRAITLPIRRLQKASRLIAEGRLDYKVGSTQQDEIGELARSMDEMANRLTRARQARQQLVNILDMTPDFVAVCDTEGNISYLNQGARRMVGLGDEADISGLNIKQFYSEQAVHEILNEGIPAAIRDGMWIYETAVLAPDGTEVPVSKVLLAHKDKDGKVQYLSTIMRDLREVKRLESKVEQNRDELVQLNRSLQEQVRSNTEVNRKLEQRIDEDEKAREAMLIMMEDLNELNFEIELGKREWETTFDAVAHPIFLHDADGKIIRVNKAYAHKAGKPPAELIGRPYWQVFPKAKSRPACCTKPETTGIDFADGETFYRLYMYPVYGEGNRFVFSVHFMQDITARKRTQMELQESQKRYSHLFEAVTDAVFVNEVNPDGSPGRIIEVNGQACLQTGYPREQLLGMTFEALNAVPEEPGMALVSQGLKAGESVRYERMQATLDGEAIPVEIHAQKFNLGERDAVISLVRDISDRVHSEMELEHANRALLAISEVNRKLVYAEQEMDLLRSVCQTIRNMPAYRMAWVGYARDNVEKDVDVVASAGVPKELMKVLRPGWDEDERSSGPTGRAVHTGKTQLSRDLAGEPSRGWKEALYKAGCVSGIALPLKARSGSVFGVLHVYSGELDAFTDREIALLEEMADDLAFGVDVLRIRLEHDQTLKLNERHLAEIHHNLEETILAISKAVEARDPYTAGHQLRVAELACAIGKEMGLDEDHIEGIRMGAIIHDIGKIQTPAEILSKPSRLTEIEYMIIKEHPKTGYEILREIHFPWPVAEIAYQHHERVNGTGYPQGLKGDQMCPEARIVAVADVVEAMTSHRPYRAGLGIEAAKAEIIKNKGKFYDPDSVDACLKVLDAGFEWSRIESGSS